MHPWWNDVLHVVEKMESVYNYMQVKDSMSECDTVMWKN